jgi:hypothetical protein
MTNKALRFATVGCVLVVIAMAAVALVLVDKPHFGFLVGTWFLAVISSGVIVGGLVLLIATWNLPQRGTWRGVVLFIWALVALTSPVFGIMFLFPWGVLALTLPLIIWILATMPRAPIAA